MTCVCVCVRACVRASVYVYVRVCAWVVYACVCANCTDCALEEYEGGGVPVSVFVRARV